MEVLLEVLQLFTYKCKGKTPKILDLKYSKSIIINVQIYKQHFNVVGCG